MQQHVVDAVTSYYFHLLTIPAHSSPRLVSAASSALLCDTALAGDDMDIRRSGTLRGQPLVLGLSVAAAL